jgi:hypothetical protein
MRIALEHEDLQPRPGEKCGIGQAIVAGPNNDGIVFFDCIWPLLCNGGGCRTLRLTEHFIDRQRKFFECLSHLYPHQQLVAGITARRCDNGGNYEHWSLPFPQRQTLHRLASMPRS